MTATYNRRSMRIRQRYKKESSQGLTRASSSLKMTWRLVLTGFVSVALVGLVQIDAGLTETNDETVRVVLSSVYGQDGDLRQQYAALFTNLPHGSELSRVTVYVAPESEVRRFCVRHVTGCYDPTDRRIYLAHTSASRSFLQQIAAHEYGHHIANSRDNTPWHYSANSAFDYGPKRWATYQRVCERVAAGTAFPGGAWDRDPSEAFAEAYRLFANVALGRPDYLPFQADRSFLPNQEALEAIQADVFDPWKPSRIVWRVVVPGKTLVKRQLALPLDGTLSVTAQGAPKRTTVYIYGRAVRALAAGGATARATVCGLRSVSIGIRTPARASVRLAITRP